MNYQNYLVFRMGAGVLATIGFYSVLYRENKFYRLFEHMYIGLAVGYSIVALWSETLHDLWWHRMLGSHAVLAHGNIAAQPASQGHWAWMLLLPLGLLGYTVFNRKYNWLSRIPIGMIIGFNAGQQIQIWFNQYGPQMKDSMRPIFPSTLSSFFVPDTLHYAAQQAAEVKSTIFASQAINNFLFVLTLTCVLSYFLFSFEVKSKILRGVNTLGRWLLMVGFGAIFGSTVAMRFTLVIDRMYFIFIEFLKQGVLHR